MLGDFTWHGRDDEAILSDRLKHVLEPLLDDHSLREIAQTQIFETPGVNEGKPLWELADLPVARLDLETSGVSIIAECEECGWRTFDIDGKTSLVVDADTWRNWNFFSVAEFQMMFVTAPVIECLNLYNATNFRVRRSATIK